MFRVYAVALTSLAALFALVAGVELWSGLTPNSRLGREFAWMHTPPDGAMAPQLAALVIKDHFDLTGPGGARVTSASFPGKWQLVYFGYTTCPDVCPTTLQTIAAALRQAPGVRDRIAPIFITIDPNRDTPAVLARYTKLFDPAIIGLTGSDAAIRAAEAAFRVTAIKVPEPGSQAYLMNHSSFVYLFNPHGKLRGFFNQQMTAAGLAGQLRQIVS